MLDEGEMRGRGEGRAGREPERKEEEIMPVTKSGLDQSDILLWYVWSEWWVSSW